MVAKESGDERCYRLMYNHIARVACGGLPMLAAASMMGDVMTEVLWNRMTAEELRQKAVDDAIVLLPVASTEQHGPHLATGVDAFLGGEGCQRTAELVAKQKPVVVAPTVWMGLA